MLAEHMIYRFDNFELDTDKAELRENGQARAIEPQVFDLLAFLVENRERLLSKNEIFEKVWDGRIVSDSALTSRVKAARKVLGDDGQAQRFIRTIHGKGLRFVADVHPERAPELAVVADTDADLGGSVAAGETPRQPSIAVLPFHVLGDAGRYATIADGLPHELITELARLRWLFVIARASSFRLRGQELDSREVGRRLGVRYCLSGTVEVSGSQLAITTELVDSRGGDVVWAERYTGFVDDVHAVREEIRAKILAALEIQIPLHEASGARLIDSANLDAWSAYHLGLQHMYNFNRADNAVAMELFGQAVTKDPAFARAHAGLSFVHFQKAFLRHTDDMAGTIAMARQCAQRGVDIDPLDPFVNFAMGRTYWLEGDLDRALAWIDRSVSLSPNYAQGLYARAWTETIAGSGAEGRRDVDLSMRLSPLDPLYYAMLGTRGFTHMLDGEYSEAVKWCERAARSPGAHVLIAMIAAAAQWLVGNEDVARRWAANVRERNPALTSTDFFGAFPLRSDSMRKQVSGALQALGF
jgi:TolB-like protein/DNA-binding winged helix-turn-helix (wHTH) protein/Flp pilus assembly protein TadD